MPEINGRLDGVPPVTDAAIISNLRDLIYRLRSNEYADLQFLETVGKFESKLGLYITEISGVRTIMRFGDGQVVTLVNHSFRDEFHSDEWSSYLLERRKACVVIFEKMLAQVIADENVDPLD